MRRARDADEDALLGTRHVAKRARFSARYESRQRNYADGESVDLYSAGNHTSDGKSGQDSLKLIEVHSAAYLGKGHIVRFEDISGRVPKA